MKRELWERLRRRSVRPEGAVAIVAPWGKSELYWRVRGVLPDHLVTFGADSLDEPVLGIECTQRQGFLVERSGRSCPNSWS